MGRTSTVFCLAALLAANTPTRGQETMAFQEVAFTAAYDRMRQLYVLGLPPDFKAELAHDLLIALHGHGSDRWQYPRDPRDECRATRDFAIKHHMIFVSPDYRAKTSWMGPRAEADLVQIITDLKREYRVGRVIVSGASMGGSSALTFAALHPELTDGVALANGTANHLEYENFQDAIRASFGGTKTEVPAEYKKRSAEYWPERLTMPIAITAGGKDTSVPADSVVRLAGILKKLNRPVLLIYRENGGHHTTYDDNLRALEFAIAPATAAPGSVQLLRDLEYVQGGHGRNRLDLYLPEKGVRPLPVILWVHGGGWTNGDKTNGPAFRFATKGYAVASMNYRFSQHAIFPAQIHDCKAAVRWLRAHARSYGLDADHIGAWGASAGGQLVALLGTTAGVKELEGPGGNADQSSRVQAVVDWFGPTDFLTVGAKETRTQLLGGDPQQNREKAMTASPITYVSKDAAPFLIMHGDQDKTVPISQSETFAEALKKAGADATFVIVKGGKHGGALFTNAESMEQIEAFFARHLGGPRPAHP